MTIVSTTNRQLKARRPTRSVSAARVAPKAGISMATYNRAHLLAVDAMDAKRYHEAARLYATAVYYDPLIGIKIPWGVLQAPSIAPCLPTWPASTAAGVLSTPIRRKQQWEC